MIARTSTIALLVCRGFGWRAPACAALVLGLALVAARLHPEVADEPVDTRVGWLHVALCLLSAWLVARCIESWPGFGRERSDGLWTRRLRLGALDGGGAALASTIAVLLPLAVLVAIAFDALGRPGREAALVTRAVLEVAADSPLRLDARRPRVELELPAATAAETLVLRPAPVLGRAPGSYSCVIEVLVDGRPHPASPITVELASPALRLPIAGTVQRVSLVLREGGLPLEWPLGTAVLTRRSTTPRWLSAALTGLATLGDVALTLALLVLARRALATPLLHALALATLAVLALSGRSPLDAAATAHARDQWSFDAATGAALTRALLLSGVLVSVAAASATLRRR